MDAESVLERIRKRVAEDILNCIGCRKCLNVCPVASKNILIGLLNEAFYNGGKLDQMHKRFMEQCMQCGFCEAACASCCSRRLHTLWLKTKNDPPKGYVKFSQLRGPGIWAGSKLSMAFAKPPPGIPKEKIDARHHGRADTLFYLGCHGMFAGELTRNFIDIAARAGVDYEILIGHRHCCGRRHLLAGDVKTYAECVNSLAKTILDIGPKTVVTACCECVSALEEISGSARGEERFRIVHSSSWLQEKIGGLEFGESQINVAYFPSCRSARRGLEATSQNVLASICGGVFPDRGATPYCCGAQSFGQRIREVDAAGRLHVENAASSGAEILAVDCANCIPTLEKAGLENGLKVMHLVSLVHDRLADNEEDQ